MLWLFTLKLNLQKVVSMCILIFVTFMLLMGNNMKGTLLPYTLLSFIEIFFKGLELSGSSLWIGDRSTTNSNDWY